MRHHFFNVNPGRKRGIHHTRRALAGKLREWLWPSIGWWALLRWLELKIKRSNGSPHSLAMGVACGVFTSFTPYLGLHSLTAIVLALLARGNIIVAVIGTSFGNPWTFPLMWISTYKLGNLFLGRTDPVAFPKHFDFSHMIHDVFFYFHTYLWPMTLGSIPLGIIFGAAFYFLLRWNIEKYRAVRRARLEAAREKHRERLASHSIKSSS